MWNSEVLVGIPTIFIPATHLLDLPFRLMRNSEGGIPIQVSLLFSFTLGGRMSKIKVLFHSLHGRFVRCCSGIPESGHSGAFPGSQLNGASPSATPIEILTADGGDPVPPPRPLPWLGVAS